VRSSGLLEADSPRVALSKAYIRGRGLEIGALHNPLWVPTKTHVVYVDRLDGDGLRADYPELSALPLVEVDVIDDGEKLDKFRPNSQDFIIANHFLEHTQNPIGTIRRHLEVLREGGVLFMAVPDKRFTFDVHRPETDFAHVLRDDLEGPEWSHEDHLIEYGALVARHSGDALASYVDHLRTSKYSIHFHVWSEASLRDFLERIRSELGLRLKIEAFVFNAPFAENICIIRKVIS